LYLTTVILVENLDQQEAFTSAKKMFNLGSAVFESGNTLRTLWDSSFDTGTNFTQIHNNRVEKARLERKKQRENSKVHDSRCSVPRSFYPRIAAEYDRWQELDIRMDGECLKQWLAPQGFTVSIRSAQRLIHTVLGLDYGKYDKAQGDWSDRTQEKRDFCLK